MNPRKRERCNFIRPVEMYCEQTPIIPEEAEYFGAVLNATEISQAADCDFSDNISDAGDVVDCINYLLEVASDTLTDDSQSSDDQSEEETQEDIVDSLDNACVAGIIQQASNFVFLSKQLEKIKGHDSLTGSIGHQAYLNKNVNCIFSSFESREKSDSHNATSDLDSFLLANNIRKVIMVANAKKKQFPLPGIVLEQLSNDTLSSEAKTHLERIGLVKASTAPNADVTEVATSLRRLVVDKWLSNPGDYEPFLTSEQNYYTGAVAFLQGGHFAEELGNSMPLAASNALRIPILVFTSMLNFPVLPVYPRENVLNENPIFLAYDMEFAGHYDAVESIPRMTTKEDVCRPLPARNTIIPDCTESLPQVSCRCGQGATRKIKGRVFCHEYKSGCKCFQNVLGCSDYCQCINCGNPHGKKVNISQPISQIVSRKRRHHDNTTLTMSSKSYSEQKAGGTTVVHWTLFEEHVLLGLVTALMERDLLELEILHREYNRLVGIVELTSLENFLSKKTQQVEQKFSALISSKRSFETLMKEQTRLNNELV